MKDPIERQMAIDALHVWFNINMVTEKDMSDHIHDLELIINHIIGLQKVALRKLPSAQPEQYWIDSEGNVSTLPFAQKTGKWIPVTERLPKDGEEVFVYLFNPKSPYIAWVEDGCWYTEEFKVNRKYEPLAWMPLPEPWKGEQHERSD